MAVCSVIIGYQRQIKVPMLSKEAIARIGNFLLTGKPFGFAQELDESWEEDTEPVEEDIQQNYGTLSQEDFIRGEMVLGLSGYDIENMTDEEEIKVLTENPDYLKLVPKFDVYGQWVHVIRPMNVEELEPTINSMVGKNQEICVTDANEKEFWNFSGYRRFGLVFEGLCKIVWNADMFSSTNPEGKLDAVDSQKRFIDKMTEGWLNLAEVQLVGLRVKNDKLVYEDAEKIKEVVDRLGIEWSEGGGIEKQLVGSEVISFEEAQAYFDIPVDFDSPEHLFEGGDALSEGQTYQDFYDQELMQQIRDGEVEEVKNMLYQGADPNCYNGSPLVLAAEAGNVELVNLMLQSGADPKASYAALGRAAGSGNIEVVKILLAAGADPAANFSYSLILAAQLGYLDIVQLLLSSGADPRADKSDALRLAVSEGHDDVAKILLAAGSDPKAENSEALNSALSKGNIEMAKLLIKAGANPKDATFYNYKKLEKLGLV